MRTSLWLIVVLCLGASSLQAQRILYLKKEDSAKRKLVKLYSIVKVKTVQDSSYSGSLNEIAPDAIAIDDNYIKLEDIRAIRTYDMVAKTGGQSLQKGSVLFAAIFVANNLITGSRPILTEENMFFIGGLLIAGVALELVAGKWYRLDKNWKAEVIIMED